MEEQDIISDESINLDDSFPEDIASSEECDMEPKVMYGADDHSWHEVPKWQGQANS